MRRALAAAALVVAATSVSLAPAAAHGDYTGGWTDPPPGGVLDGLRGISGSVGHVHGIQAVSLNLVEPDGDAPDECDAGGGPWAPVNGNGEQQVSFTFQVVFPCNILYRVEGLAQAGAGEGSTFDPDPAPAPFQMTAVVAVAIPAEPVGDLQARLSGDEDAPKVRISWAEGLEPDIERYVVLRDGEPIGEVDEGDDTVLVDDDPITGTRSTYEVVAVRSGPRGEVAGRPASDSIDVPAPADEDEDQDDDDTPTDGDDSEDDGDAGADDSSTDGGASPGTTTGGGGGSQPAPGGVPSRPVSGGPPTTLDTGFQETLPFGEAPPQEVAAPPAGDGSVVAAFDDDDDAPILNPESWKFIAAGLALLMGSMVIRHVNRRAAAGY